MSTTLTIRNLDEGVKQKLRMRAARKQTSMEAEARAILAQSLAEDAPEPIEPPCTPEEMRARLEAIRGIWADRMEGKTTDEWMREIRGDE